MNEVDRAERIADLLWGVRRSVRYHDRRQGFFERCHVLVMALVVLSGSATIAAFGSSLAADWSLEAKLFPAALITVLSTLDIMFGFSARTTLHSNLKRRFINLERELVPLEYDPDPPEDAVNKLWLERLSIEADEPPVLRVLDSICHNELMRAKGHKDNELCKISLLSRLLSSFIDWKPQDINNPMVSSTSKAA